MGTRATVQGDIAQEFLDTITQNIKLSVSTVFSSVVNQEDFKDGKEHEGWEVPSPEVLLIKYNELLVNLQQANEAGIEYIYSEDDLGFLNKYFDRDSPRMFVSLEQSSFFDAFRDKFYSLSPNKVRAVKTMSFNNDVARTEFDRLMSEYCASKGFSVIKAVGSYEFSMDASVLLAAMQRNRHLIAVRTIFSAVEGMLKPLLIIAGEINTLSTEANKRSEPVDLSDEQIDFLNKHFSRALKNRYILNISSDDLEHTAYSSIIDGMWRNVMVLNHENAKGFIAAALDDVWRKIEDKYRWKKENYTGEADGYGTPPNIRLVSMHSDEMTQTQEEAFANRGIGKRLADGVLNMLNRGSRN